MLPLSLFLCFLTAAVFHEIFHYLAVRIVKTPIYSIKVGMFGVSMGTGPMTPGRELLSAAAGPMGSLILAVCYRWIPVTALCALAQCVFNLLPVYPLDGWRILKCLLELLRLPGSDRILRGVGILVPVGIGMLCLYACFVYNGGIGVLILGMAVLLRIFPRKTPCKDGLFGVQ